MRSAEVGVQINSTDDVDAVLGRPSLPVIVSYCLLNVGALAELATPVEYVKKRFQVLSNLISPLPKASQLNVSPTS